MTALDRLADVDSCRRTARELHALADACRATADLLAEQRRVHESEFDGSAAEAFRVHARELATTADLLHDRVARLARAMDTFAEESATTRQLVRTGDLEAASSLQASAEAGLHAALVRVLAPDHPAGFRAHHAHRHRGHRPPGT